MSKFEMKWVLGYKYGTPLVPWAQSVCPEWADRDQFTLVLCAMAIVNGEEPDRLWQHIAVNSVHTDSFIDKMKKLADGPPITQDEFRARMELIPALGGDPVRVAFRNPGEKWKLRLQDWYGGHIVALYLRCDGGPTNVLRDGRYRDVQKLTGWGLYWWRDAKHNQFYRWVKVSGWAEAQDVVQADGPVSIRWKYGVNGKEWCADDRVDAIIGTTVTA